LPNYNDCRKNPFVKYHPIVAQLAKFQYPFQKNFKTFQIFLNILALPRNQNELRKNFFPFPSQAGKCDEFRCYDQKAKIPDLAMLIGLHFEGPHFLELI